MKKNIKFLLVAPLVIYCFINIAIFLMPTYHIKHSNEYTIFDRDDHKSFTMHFFGMSEYVPLNEISPFMIKSIIASEDKRFFRHFGLDYQRIIVSLFNNIIHHKIVSGGSTISQQLARTLFLNNQKTLKRKIKESIIARKIEMSYQKNEILEAYLNSVYFGHNIYGIDEASYYFFNKTPKELTLSESALLSGIISAPSYYSPNINLNESIKKKQQVLRLLYDQNAISFSQYQNALNEQLNFYFKKKSYENRHLLYSYDYILDCLKEQNIFNKNGLDIYTTLDQNITSIVNNTLSSFKFNDEENQVSVVIMKPFSGDILALVGGNDYSLSPFNRSVKSFRQTGSAIKPLLYYLALEKGMNTTSKLISKPTTFLLENGLEYTPKNALDKYANGPINMIEALALSDNIYATKTLLLVGSKNFASFIERFDIKDVLSNPTLGLGSKEMSPLQLAAIYNCFASEGSFYKPNIIKNVQNKDGENIYQNITTPSFTLNKEIVVAINYMLLSPFDQNITSYTNPSLLNYQTNKKFCAKTGSTISDSWVVGFNKDLTILIHYGNDKNNEIKNGGLAKQLFVKIANNLATYCTSPFYQVPSSLKPFNMTYGTKQTNTYYAIY